MPDIADRKSAELEASLWEASENGKYPVLCDQSPCLHRMRETIKKMKLYEPAEFIYIFLRDKLEFTPINRPVAIHITCSMRRMGLTDTLLSLARLCSTQVIIPEEVGCCGLPETKVLLIRKSIVMLYASCVRNWKKQEYKPDIPIVVPAKLALLPTQVLPMCLSPIW